MKKLLATLLTLALLITGAALAESAPSLATTLTHSEDPTTGALILQMAANATTGYSWTYTLSAEGMLEEVGNQYIPDEATDGAVGVGGTQEFSFMPSQGATAGTVTLTFTYSQPWAGIVEDSFELDITMNEAGALTVGNAREPRKDETVAYRVEGEGRSLLIDLKSNPTTGYTWTYKVLPENLLMETRNEFELPAVVDVQAGTGGIHHLSFATEEATRGAVTLTLSEGRSWEEDVLQTYEISLEIGDKGVITVTDLRKVEK